MGIPTLLCLTVLRTLKSLQVLTNVFTNPSEISGPIKPLPKFADWKPKMIKSNSDCKLHVPVIKLVVMMDDIPQMLH